MTDPTRRFGQFLIELGFVTEVQVQQGLALQPLTGARMGEALLSLGFLTRSQLQRALSLAVAKGQTVLLDRPLLGEVLLGLDYVKEQALEHSLAEQQATGKRLGEVLLERGHINHKQLYEALGVQQRMGQTPPSTGDTPLPVPGVRSIVVIDDSDISCALVAQGLEAQGYRVTTFTDPFVALEQLDLLKPDLVLSDLAMPGLDGAQLCHRLKLGPRALPVIMLTANDADEQRVAGLRAGAVDYVNKGASMEELGARIETVLRRTTETERVRRLFARYTSDAVVHEVMRTGGVALTGERREVTVMFADLRNFTGYAEGASPEEVMRVLNRVLGGLADVVLELGGTLDKFLGDGLMAVWGAPVSKPDDVDAAVLAALTMFDLMGRIGGPLQLGIGVNTGPAIAGSVGSARRTEYTCVGDTVNVASRLCGMAAGGELLIGGQTAHALAAPLALKALAPVRVKGRMQPVPLFAVRPELRSVLEARRRG